MAGLIAVFLGMFGKFSALFVSMPEPVFGGVFMIILGKIYFTSIKQGSI